MCCCSSLSSLGDDSSDEETDGWRRKPRPGWWDDADVSARASFDGLKRAAQLRDVRVVRHEPAAGQALVASSGPLYEEMGVVDTATQYVAVWLTMNDASLVFLSKATDLALLQRCLAGDFIKERLKLILVPVEVKLPFPAKGPRDAETVGSFFGPAGASSTTCRTPKGAEVACVQIDLYSKWVMRLAMQKGGLRIGNTIELVLVDWDERAVLAGLRLIVTEEFAALLV